MPQNNSDVCFSQANLVIISGLLATLGGVVTLLFKLLMKTKDDQYAQVLKEKEAYFAALEKERDEYRSMAETAINNLELSIKKFEIAKDSVPLSRAAEIIHDVSSRPDKETEPAILQSKLTAASLALNLHGEISSG